MWRFRPWRVSLEWFEKSQQEDGGFGYANSGVGDPSFNKSYGSMSTAGAVALAACYRYLAKDPKKKDFKKEPKLLAAADWIGKNFIPSENPSASHLQAKWFVYYYLYGIERDGAFLETDKFGNHKWYDEGAAWLVKGQGADGSWAPIGQWEAGRPELSLDTCFAILFLKRATQEIIETGTGKGNQTLIEQK